MLRSPARLTPHRCQTCDYDRSGLPDGAACPECGSPPPHQAAGVSAGASRALIGLGMGALSWLGLVGFGVVGVLLGMAAVGVSVSAMQMLKDEGGRDHKPLLIAMGGLGLGLTAILGGLLISAFILGNF